MLCHYCITAFLLWCFLFYFIFLFFCFVLFCFVFLFIYLFIYLFIFLATLQLKFFLTTEKKGLKMSQLHRAMWQIPFHIAMHVGFWDKTFFECVHILIHKLYTNYRHHLECWMLFYPKLCSHMQLLPVISLPGISPMQLKFFRWSTNASTLVSISTYTR